MRGRGGAGSPNMHADLASILLPLSYRAIDVNALPSYGDRCLGKRGASTHPSNASRLGCRALEALGIARGEESSFPALHP